MDDLTRVLGHDGKQVNRLRVVCDTSHSTLTVALSPLISGSTGPNLEIGDAVQGIRNPS